MTVPMIDQSKVELYAQLIAMRHLMIKTFVKAFAEWPPEQFNSMADAWVEQLSGETYPHLGAELSDHLAAEVQEVLADMVQQAKLFRAELERIADGKPSATDRQ